MTIRVSQKWLLVRQILCKINLWCWHFCATLAEKGQFKVVGGNKMATLATNSKIRILILGL